MRKIRGVIWATLVIFATIILWHNEYIVPVIAFFLYFSTIGEYLLERRNLGIGKFLAAGKNSNRMKRALTWLAGGLLSILWGVTANKGSLSFNGIPAHFYITGYFILNAIISYYQSLFLLTDNSIIFEGSIGQEEWKYKKLDKMIIGDKEIQIFKGNESKTLPIEKEDKELIRKIHNFLSPKLENRIIVDEAQCITNAIANAGF